VQVADTTPGSSATTELETGSASEAVSFPEPAARLQASGEIPTGDGAAPQASTLAANRAATTDGIDCSIKFRISFDNDSSRLSEAAREQLDAVVSDCLDTGSNKVRVTGYTDTWGGWDYNLRLSRQRAEAAAAYLIEQGVNPESVYAEGLGEYGMDQAAAGPEANADDRRIVLVEIMPVESPP
jgi:outer membrane protein OmpA-like peptidoglycan-associated protein